MSPANILSPSLSSYIKVYTPVPSNNPENILSSAPCSPLSAQDRSFWAPKQCFRIIYRPFKTKVFGSLNDLKYLCSVGLVFFFFYLQENHGTTLQQQMTASGSCRIFQGLLSFQWGSHPCWFWQEVSSCRLALPCHQLRHFVVQGTV